MEVAKDLPLGRAKLNDKKMKNELYATICIKLNDLEALKE